MRGEKTGVDTLRGERIGEIEMPMRHDHEIMVDDITE